MGTPEVPEHVGKGPAWAESNAATAQTSTMKHVLMRAIFFGSTARSLRSTCSLFQELEHTAEVCLFPAPFIPEFGSKDGLNYIYVRLRYKNVVKIGFEEEDRFLVFAHVVIIIFPHGHVFSAVEESLDSEYPVLGNMINQRSHRDCLYVSS
jgi:hypothetical protein